MEQENDLLLSKLAVRLRDSNTSLIIGSGSIYNSDQIKNHIYVFTAAHCLYYDGDLFSQPRNQVEVDIYNSLTNSYITVSQIINYDLVVPDINKDVAVLIIDKAVIKEIVLELSFVEAVQERQSFTTWSCYI